MVWLPFPAGTGCPATQDSRVPGPRHHDPGRQASVRALDPPPCLRAWALCLFWSLLAAAGTLRGQEFKEWPHHGGSLQAARFARAADRLVTSGSLPGRIVVWDTAGWQPVRVWNGLEERPGVLIDDSGTLVLAYTARHLLKPGTLSADKPLESRARNPNAGGSRMGQLLSIVLAIVFLPFTILGCFVIVHPQEEKVILFWGNFRRILKKPGLHVINLWGRKVITVSTKRQTLDLARTVVADGNGNPIIIAAIVTYQYTEPYKVALAVENAHEFVKTQAMAVLKQVASKYPYESADGHSLKSEAQVINRQMVAALQTKVEAAGTQILGFELSDLSYAPEIAQAMLVRQQAQALVDARKTVVEGAVEIVHDAVQRLGEKGLELEERERSRLVANLLTVICGEARVQPTYPIHGPVEREQGIDEQMLRVLEGIRKNTAKTES